MMPAQAASLLVLTVTLGVVVAKPNIVVVMTDDLSFKEYGFGGNKQISTPFLDRMAEQGVNFKKAWATDICQPTRAMLMTGEYATTTDWWGQDEQVKTVNLGDEIGTFGHVAKSAGYRTLIVGKWQLLFGTAKSHGFDSYCLWDHSDIMPFFDLRRIFVDEYGGEKFNKEDRDGAGVPNRYWQPLVVRHLGKDRHKILNTTSDKFSFGPQIFLDCIRDFIAESKKPFFIYFPGVTGHQHWDKVLKKQAWIGMPKVDKNFKIIGREPEGTGSLKSNVEWTDTMMGRLRRILSTVGVRKNTAVFFTSDNGSPGYGKGQTRSEFGVHVPLIAWGGPIKKRKPSFRLVSLIDLYATIVHWTGGKQISGNGKTTERKRRNSLSLVPFLEKRGKGVMRRVNVSYRLRSKIIVRNGQFILDGDNVFWDCRRNKDERGCKPVSNPASQFASKFRRLKRKKAKFLTEKLNVRRF